MKTKLLTIEQWNMIPKDEETQVEAVEGDTALLINGVAFLIQRKNNWNNVVCIRLKPSRINIVQTFETFRAFCQKNDIQYFRVEGISHTYRMLYLVCRLGRKNGADCDVRYHATESAEYNRHIYYVKAY
jgi:hypothetical protein